MQTHQRLHKLYSKCTRLRIGEGLDPAYQLVNVRCHGYGGGMCGMRGSIGPLAFALMDVESLAVRVPVSRPGSIPLFCTSSSPRVVPGVWDGIIDFCV